MLPLNYIFNIQRLNQQTGYTHGRYQPTHETELMALKDCLAAVSNPGKNPNLRINARFEYVEDQVTGDVGIVQFSEWVYIFYLSFISEFEFFSLASFSVAIPKYFISHIERG